MNCKRIVSTLLLSSLAVLSIESGLAYEREADRPAAVARVVAPEVKHTAKPSNKWLDINSASPAALKKLPGITDEQAQRIVTNRPYGSKAWLVTQDIIDRPTYSAIKSLIEARQPYKTAEKNAALYEKLGKK